MIFYDADGDGCVVAITDIFFNNFQLGCNFRSDIKTFLPRGELSELLFQLISLCIFKLFVFFALCV